MVTCPPTFGMYEFLARIYDADFVAPVPRNEDFTLDLPALERVLDGGAKILHLASPNNPTGNAAAPRANCCGCWSTQWRS